MRIARSWFVASCFVAAGCGGSEATPAAEAPVSAPVAEAPVSAPVAPPAARREVPQASDESAVAAEASSSTKEEPSAEDSDATRTVTYTVVPGGSLKISVGGVKFTVSASAVRVASGWGVKVNVVSSASDGKPHSLSSPKAGPLAFAGTVQRKGAAEPEQFGDEREGDGERAIFGDDPTKFSRSWPLKGTRVLGVGDALDLQIALWGLGTEKDARRPVKQFCHVTLQVEKGLPRAKVEPPASASGR